MSLDRRLNAHREDLADIRLKGTVNAARYAAGRPARIATPVEPCLRRPAADAPLDTEFLLGEPVTVFDEENGFAWVQSGDDGYVGYVATTALAPMGPEPTHRICVPLALVYAAPSIKVPVLLRVPLGARLALGPQQSVGGERFHPVAGGGYILAQHVGPLAPAGGDYVSLAERFLGTPYLFGGKSWLGIDCSALVQLSLQSVGQPAPRDSDMQEDRLGSPLPIDPAAALIRGDLVFWKGHVGIMVDGTTLLHANGHHMTTAAEPLADTLARLTALGLPPTAMRRPRV